MKLACPTCQARYSIADEKLRGKVVKIRCKRCGAIVAVGPLAEPVAAPLAATTGARDEASVLFTLSALQGERARPSSAVAGGTGDEAGSGLIDLRMLAVPFPPRAERKEAASAVAHLGTGGVFVSPLVSRLTSEPDPSESGSPHRARRAGVVAGLLFAVILPCVVAAFVSQRVTASRPAPREPAAAPVMPLLSALSAPPVVASASETVAPTPEPLPAPTVVARAPTMATPTSTPVRVPKATPAPFDAAAAARALALADLRPCGPTEGPRGPRDGHVQVTIQPGGVVSDAVVDTPELAGATAACIASAFRRVRVAPFAGSALTVGKRFSVTVVQ